VDKTMKIVIIVSDHTRLTPSALIVPEILKDLKTTGIPEQSITIAVATGMHRKTSPAELQKMLGDEIVNNFRISVNECQDENSHTELGKTTRRTPVQVDKYVAEADFVIGLGCVEPHQQAGWSGGAKVVMPGVSSRTAILANHAYSFHPDALLGKLEGNPIREDAEEYAGIAGLKFIINTILNEKGKIVKAFAGHPIKAHRAGVEEMKQYIGIDLEKKPDITIVSLNGHPRDFMLWMSEGKGLARIYHIVPDGGIAILVARCQEGFGDSGFENYLGTMTINEIISKAKSDEFSIPAFKSYCIANHLKRAYLFLVVEGLNAADTPKLPICYFNSLQNAVDEAIKIKGANSSMVVVPNGPSVLLSAVESVPLSNVA
jgi:nickel-dependent lactate racemase